MTDPWYGIGVHAGFRLPEGFLAITLFGHVFFHLPKGKLTEYLQSDEGRITMHHEQIHRLQAQSFRTKYFGFYLSYIYYWFHNLAKGMRKGHQAYYNIPFEREAYAKQGDLTYCETHWREYR